jgi:hypothetical protein
MSNKNAAKIVEVLDGVRVAHSPPWDMRANMFCVSPGTPVVDGVHMHVRRTWADADEIDIVVAVDTGYLDCGCNGERRMRGHKAHVNGHLSEQAWYMELCAIHVQKQTARKQRVMMGGQGANGTMLLLAFSDEELREELRRRGKGNDHEQERRDEEAKPTTD